jgi:RND family efflux transporter MFP subunit
MLTVGDTEQVSGLRFPGRVRAVQRAELAFNVPGRIVEFPAEEGAAVEAGALIARLDAQSYEVTLSSARARYDKARTDYERVLKIWEKSQAVARAEVDRLRTDLEVARSSYAAAKQDFDDTSLRAPFTGVVVRRHVENFQNVRAKDPVVSLQDVDDLEVVIHVPERVIRSEPRQVAGFAQFEDIPGRRFPVTLSAYAAEADPQTQTYEVVLGLTRPQDVKILPGMSAEIIPAASTGGTGDIMVPLAAVTAAADGEPRVWVFSPETGRVAARAVEVGSVAGDGIVITAGLAEGDRIVTAGLTQLHEGMLVRPLD